MQTSNQMSVVECRVERRKAITVKKRIRTIVAVTPKDLSAIRIDLTAHLPATAYKKTRDLTIKGDKAVYTEGRREKLTQRVSPTTTYYHAIVLIHRLTHVAFADIETILSNSGLSREKLTALLHAAGDIIEPIVDQITKSYYNYEYLEADVVEELKLVNLDGDTFHFNVSKDQIGDGLLVYREDPRANRLGFHINPYRFDSSDEKELFAHLRAVLESDERVADIYFTGATDQATLTDFHFTYEHQLPEGLKIRTYFPDMLVEITNSA